MEINFWNQYPCMPSWPSVSQFATFLNLALIESRCILAFGPSSSPFSSFPMLFIHSTYLSSSFRFHILLQNCFLCLPFGWWLCLCIMPLPATGMFFVFWNALLLITFQSSFFHRYLLVYFLKFYCLFYWLCYFFFLFVPTCYSLPPLCYHFLLLVYFLSAFAFKLPNPVLRYYYFLLSFSHQLTLMVFHWSFSDSTSPQVSRTLLIILAVHNNAVVWIVSTRPPTSMSSSPFNNPLVTLPKGPITIGIIVKFILLQLLQSLLLLRFFHTRLSCWFSSETRHLWSPGLF